MQTRALWTSPLNRRLARHAAAALRGGRAVATCLRGQAFAIQDTNPTTANLDQTLVLKPAQGERHRLARRADEARQVLMRQRQTNLPRRAVLPAMRLDELLQQRDDPFAVGAKENVPQAILDAPPPEAEQLAHVQREFGTLAHEPEHVVARDRQHQRLFHRLGILVARLIIDDRQLAEQLARA